MYFLKTASNCRNVFRLFISNPFALRQPLQQRRSLFEKGRSFLSDKEGAKNFIELLSSKERRLLREVLHEKEMIIGSDTNQSKEPPSLQQLKLIFIHQALPFIGFGFLDNFIMIIAGDYIDTTIGVTLGISTMAAAGLGNAVSDVAGIGSAWYVETIAGKIGVEYPKISEAQSDMPRTRWCVQLGRVFGITVGCLLGMLPLLFLPRKHDTKSNPEDT